MTPTTSRRIETYLDDLARMLAGADPVLRADVLGGVREHVDAALADRPGPVTDGDVDHVLAELGPPEAVAAAALEGDGGAHRASAVPPAGGASGAWAPPTPEPRPPVLDRHWVPPIVGVLALVTTGLYLLVLGGLSFFLVGSTEVSEPAAVEVSGFSAPVDDDFDVLLPVAYDVAWSVIAPIGLVGPLWLLTVVLLAGSSLWSPRQKWTGALLLPAVVLVNLAAMLLAGSATGSVAGSVAPAVVLALAWGATAALTAVVVTRLWRAGARRARR